MWSTFSSTPLNAEEQAGLSVEFQTKERIEDDTTDDNTNDTTPSQSDESQQTGSNMGEDEPGDVTVEVSGTTGHIELRVSGLCAFCSVAVGLCIYIYIFSFSVCPRFDGHCGPQASCVFAD